MRFWLRFLAIAIFSLLTASRASADMVDFSYEWSSSSSIIVGTNTTTGNGISTGSVAFALFPNGTGSATVGGGVSPISAASISTTGSAASGEPDQFNSPFDMKLRLTDTASGAFGDLTFNGTILGTLLADASTLKANLGTPITQSLTLGGLIYTVTIDPSSVSIPAPGSPPALLGANITVAQDQGGGGPVTNTPEPASLLLAGVGLSMTLLARARFRKARSA